ncbi:MAG TPA: response regulator [Terriglobales bacterium]|jgi:CheY-like chemotaxis protein|nr:response regulator [Terriglobales bacterium]
MPRVALVVDDSMLIRHTVCRFLEENGFTVESATDGVEALEMLAHLQPSVIITDLQMPKMSGGELIAALQGRPQTAAIPVVILAARKSGPEPPEARHARFVIYKDIDIDAQLSRALAALGDDASAR